VRDIGGGPQRDAVRVGARLLGADAGEPAEGDRRAHDPHEEHGRKRDIGGIAAGPDEQRRVFEAPDRSADFGH
jgi:hypothetical protein